MIFYIVLTPISTTSGLWSTGNTHKYHQIDVYIYQCDIKYRRFIWFSQQNLFNIKPSQFYHELQVRVPLHIELDLVPFEQVLTTTQRKWHAFLTKTRLSPSIHTRESYRGLQMMCTQMVAKDQCFLFCLFVLFYSKTDQTNWLYILVSESSRDAEVIYIVMFRCLNFIVWCCLAMVLLLDFDHLNLIVCLNCILGLYNEYYRWFM